MRMLVKCSLLMLGAAGFVLAQHGGGGGHAGGSGGHGSGGGSGHVGGGGGGFHGTSSAPMSAGHSGYNGNYTTGVTPQSYSGHLTFSTPGMGTTGLSRGGSSGYVEARPTWGRPPIRRPGGGGIGYDRRRGYYGGLGFYPLLGYGYYGDDFSSPYYDNSAPNEQYLPQDQYGAGADPGGEYPPIPYALPDQQYQQQLMPQPQAPPVVATPEPPSPPITIVLKSGQKMEVRNYAIMNGMFWDFTKQNAKKIPLSAIDIAASSKATDAAGGAFPEESFGANLN